MLTFIIGMQVGALVGIFTLCLFQGASMGASTDANTGDTTEDNN